MLSMLCKSKNDRLKIHMGETKAFFNNFADTKKIKVDNKEKEIAEEYNSLGKVAKTEEGMNVALNGRLLSGYRMRLENMQKC